MKWKKLGLIFSANTGLSWHQHSALTPTPILLNDSCLRVYAGFRDQEGISRIGYVDLNPDQPEQILRISSQPVLNRGRDGCFDDNGVILGDIVALDDCLRLYYIGFQEVKRAKFLAFTGLAESRDGGESFHRVSEAPLLDRDAHATTIRAIHSVLYEQERWKIWYAAGSDWEWINNQAFPRYNIWYTESIDGVHFDQKSQLCIDVSGDEYRIGRPSVVKKDNQYYMFYTKGSIQGNDYFPGLAISTNGFDWERQDSQFGLSLSPSGFDSLHLCYPRLVTVKDKTYCIYNGNHMGKEGFGMAELLEW